MCRWNMWSQNVAMEEKRLRPSPLERERENDDEWKIREAQPNPIRSESRFNQHTERCSRNRMGSALPAIIGCPRAILSRNQTRETFFYFTGGDSVASCTVTIHLPRSKKPAPIDPLPIHHAAPLVSIPGSLSPLSSCYRMGCAIDRTRILTSSFVNCCRGTWPMLSWSKTVTLIGCLRREFVRVEFER